MMKQCYSWPLVVKVVFHNLVALVLKECRLLSACTGISPVSLLLMVLEECKIFVYILAHYFYDLVSIINES